MSWRAVAVVVMVNKKKENAGRLSTRNKPRQVAEVDGAAARVTDNECERAGATDGCTEVEGEGKRRQRCEERRPRKMGFN